MAKNISTRIGLKIDTLTAWESSTIGLLPGELAIATVAAGAGTGLTEPVIMIKVGEDGKKTFKDLDWAVHAKASDVYGWAKKSEKDFVDGFLKLSNGTQTLGQILDEIYISHDEQTNAHTQLKTELAGIYYNKTEIATLLSDYYKKTEVDAAIKVVSDALAEEVLRADAAEKKALEDAKKYTDEEVNKIVTGSGYATTSYVDNKVKAHEDAVVETLKSYSTTEEMNAAIDADVKVVADDLAAYTEAHKNDYTNTQIDAAIDADVKVVADDLAEYIEAHKNDYNNDTIDAAIKVVADDLAEYTEAHSNDYDNAAIDAAIKVVADDLAATYTNAQIDELIQGAKDYADVNDANDNTTYTISYESKVDGEGGHPARIILTPSEGEATYVDATPFIKDGMLDNVAYDAESNTLTFTFNTDAGKEAVTVELTDILAPYTGSVGETITVTVDGNTIKAELNDAVKTDIATAKADAAKAKEDAAAAVSTANSASTVAGEAKTAAQGAVTTANEAKTAATDAQNSAAASAAAAKASEEAAAGYAAEALASKGEAVSSAAAAEASRESAVNAQTFAELAQAAAVDAQGAAEKAKSDAEAAKRDAETAKAGAESAKGLAVAAQGAAETAQTKAEAAQAAAEKAKADAEDSNTSATAIANDAAAVAGQAKSAAEKATSDVAGLTTTVNAIPTTYRKVADKITSDDMADEVWVFNCGTATLVV